MEQKKRVYKPYVPISREEYIRRGIKRGHTALTPNDKEVVHVDIYQVYDHYFVAYRIYPGTIGATIGFTGRLDYQISARGLDAAKSAVTAIIGERSLIEFRGF